MSDSFLPLITIRKNNNTWPGYLGHSTIFLVPYVQFSLGDNTIIHSFPVSDFNFLNEQL